MSTTKLNEVKWRQELCHKKLSSIYGQHLDCECLKRIPTAHGINIHVRQYHHPPVGGQRWLRYASNSNSSPGSPENPCSGSNTHTHWRRIQERSMVWSSADLWASMWSGVVCFIPQWVTAAFALVVDASRRIPYAQNCVYSLGSDVKNVPHTWVVC